MIGKIIGWDAQGDFVKEVGERCLRCLKVARRSLVCGRFHKDKEVMHSTNEMSVLRQKPSSLFMQEAAPYH